MKLHRIAAAVAALVIVAGAAPAAAQSLVSTGESYARVRLVPGRADVASGIQVVGVEIALTPGWKTYWRSPGEAGISPSFDWSGSENLATAEVLWPAPVLFESFGLTTIGYSGRVMLPVRITPEDPTRPVRLRLGLALGVCHDICILEETETGTEFQPGRDGDGAAMVASAEARVPRPAAEMGITSAVCGVRGAGKERSFAAELALENVPEDAVVVVEGPEEAFIGAATVRRENPGLVVTAPVLVLDPDAWIDRSRLRMTVLAAGYAADVTDCQPFES